MTAFKLLNILVLSSLTILASFGPSSVQALSIDTAHLHFSRHARHDVIALNKRDNSTKRCKPRPSPSPSPSHAPTSSASSPPAASSPPPAPAPSPSPSSSPAPSYSGGGLAKIGIGYPLSYSSALKPFKTDKVGWVYTWSPWCPQGAQDWGFKCVPMLWGYKQIADFQRLVKAGYANYVLGMNEPNEGTQSAMSPQDGANMWKSYIQPLKSQGYTLISPACTNAPSGKQWIHDFLSACQGCTVDAVAMHWYGINYQDMINYITDFHTTFNKPIWVTEFACQDFSGRNQPCPNVYEFMGKVQDFMNNAPYVVAYAAFGVMHDMYNVNPVNQLLNGADQPTSLGWNYINN